VMQAQTHLKELCTYQLHDLTNHTVIVHRAGLITLMDCENVEIILKHYPVTNLILYGCRNVHIKFKDNLDTLGSVEIRNCQDCSLEANMCHLEEINNASLSFNGFSVGDWQWSRWSS
jgi:hypothetical protein